MHPDLVGCFAQSQPAQRVGFEAGDPGREQPAGALAQPLAVRRGGGCRDAVRAGRLRLIEPQALERLADYYTRPMRALPLL